LRVTDFIGHGRLILALLGLLLSDGAGAWTVRYIGQQILPNGHQYAGTTVGGLSGIDYDSANERYYAISDDRSERQAARFYTLKIDLAQFNTRPAPGYEGIAFTAMMVLRNQQGLPYARRSVDPESIRLAPGVNSLYWSDEGIAVDGVPPAVVEIDMAGGFRRSLAIPQHFRPRSGRGVRDNLAFESLAVTPSGSRLIVATENALVQDGPPADGDQGSPCRVLAFESARRVPVAEYVYLTDPVTNPPSLPLPYQTNGLVEMLALDEQRFLALERSFAPTVGTDIRVYWVDLDSGTNVIDAPSLPERDYRPLAKSLLINLKTFGIAADNVEGMTWGPRLRNGNRSLILVSDNNFSDRQVTQFLAFELVPTNAAEARLGR
jgi:hypothetical protein